MADDDHELLIRIDERVVTIFNQMEDFETLFTNHLSHHESWENDIKASMRWWMGIMASLIAAIFLSMQGVV
tara:strand:- start:7538 stop:7750 length:213 start_codon:yes stop_codon:yes gene_type:complete